MVSLTIMAFVRKEMARSGIHILDGSTHRDWMVAQPKLMADIGNIQFNKEFRKMGFLKMGFLKMGRDVSPEDKSAMNSPGLKPASSVRKTRAYINTTRSSTN
jgi:hypothetical protein